MHAHFTVDSRYFICCISLISVWSHWTATGDNV